LPASSSRLFLPEPNGLFLLVFGLTIVVAALVVSLIVGAVLRGFERLLRLFFQGSVRH
jgi:hypothetical protein